MCDHFIVQVFNVYHFRWFSIMVMGQITVRQILDFTLYERKLVIVCRVCRLTAHVELYLLKNNELLERKFTKIQRRLHMTLSPHTVVKGLYICTFFNAQQ